MNTSDVISIVCSILGIVIAIISLIVSIVFFKSQRKFEKNMDERDLKMQEEQRKLDEKRYQEQIAKEDKLQKEHNEAEALKFIQKYNKTDEIQLLALCVMASKYDDTFPYRRQIYKDFCCLNYDVQKEILHKMNLDVRLMDIQSEDFFDNSLKLLENDLKEYYPNNISFYEQYYYEGAKYFYRSLEYYKNEKVPDYIIAKRKSFLFPNPIPYKYKDFVTDVLAKVDDEIELTNGNKLNPSKISFEELFEVSTREDGSAHSGKEIVMCYLECIIANYVPSYLTNDTTDIINVGYYNDYFGSKDDYYMEDLFLESLLSINIYIKDTIEGGE